MQAGSGLLAGIPRLLPVRPLGCYAHECRQPNCCRLKPLQFTLTFMQSLRNCPSAAKMPVQRGLHLARHLSQLHSLSNKRHPRKPVLLVYTMDHPRYNNPPALDYSSLLSEDLSGYRYQPKPSGWVVAKPGHRLSGARAVTDTRLEQRSHQLVVR